MEQSIYKLTKREPENILQKQFEEEIKRYLSRKGMYERELVNRLQNNL